MADPDALSPEAADDIRALLDTIESRMEISPASYRGRAATVLKQIREQLERLAGSGNEEEEVAAAVGLPSTTAYYWLRAIFDSAPEGMVVADTEGHVLLANNAAERLYARPVPVGQDFSSHAELQLCYPNGTPYDPRQLPLTRSAIDGESCSDVEMLIIWPDGQRRPLLVNTAPIWDGADRRVGAVGVFQDITQRKQLEEALRESEERYRQLVELYPDLVFVQSGGRFAFINQAGARLLGADRPEEIIGKPVLDFIHPDDLEAVRQRIRSLNEDRSAVPPREERLLRLDGSAFYVDAIAVPFVYRGEPSALVIARDMTKQKALQEEQVRAATEIEIQHRLSEYREMERQEIARDLHDGPIQTLVSALFNVQVAREAIEDPNAKVEFAQVSLAMKQVVRELREVVNELRPPSLIRFGLAKALNLYVEDFREKYPGIDVVLEMDEEESHLPEQVSLALFRICQEALNNVVRHSGAAAVWFRFSILPGEYLLEIEDNGKGFTLPEDFSEQTQAGHYGLAGMRERALAAGGRLWIETQPGRGTIIRAAMPFPRR